uniref:Helitron_like_N domain-containing protein n=1 Tax=Ascaris lumbricoides TaxID=6252 RepID=A0A0M3IEE0_ASCLU
MFPEQYTQINSMFAMASTTANEEKIAGGLQVYKVCGEMYVNVSALYERGEQPAYGNYYHYDRKEACEGRQQSDRGRQIDRKLFLAIEKCLRTNNAHCKLYMQFHEVYEHALRKLRSEGIRRELRIMMRIVADVGTADSNVERIHPGRLNLPAPGQVMAVFGALEEGMPPDPKKHGTSVYSRHNRNAAPLPYWNEDAFPLLFPMLLSNGQKFYRRGIKVCEDQCPRKKEMDRANEDYDEEKIDVSMKCARKFVSQRKYALYQYAYKNTYAPHWLWAARRLAQQFVVYKHVCTEAQKLEWIRKQSKKMRAEQRDELFRKVIDDKLIAKGRKMGKAIILPNSYSGSPRNMKHECCSRSKLSL